MYKNMYSALLLHNVTTNIKQTYNSQCPQCKEYGWVHWVHCVENVLEVESLILDKA